MLSAAESLLGKPQTAVRSNTAGSASTSTRQLEFVAFASCLSANFAAVVSHAVYSCGPRVTARRGAHWQGVRSLRAVPASPGCGRFVVMQVYRHCSLHLQPPLRSPIEATVHTAVPRLLTRWPAAPAIGFPQAAAVPRRDLRLWAIYTTLPAGVRGLPKTASLAGPALIEALLRALVALSQCPAAVSLQSSMPAAGRPRLCYLCTTLVSILPPLGCRVIGILTQQYDWAKCDQQCSYKPVWFSRR